MSALYWLGILGVAVVNAGIADAYWYGRRPDSVYVGDLIPGWQIRNLYRGNNVHEWGCPCCCPEELPEVTA